MTKQKLLCLISGGIDSPVAAHLAQIREENCSVRCSAAPYGEELRTMKNKLLCLISGGIDSPVAAHMMLAKGCSVEFVNFDLTPVGNDYTRKKVEKLVKQLGKLHKKKLKLTFLEHGKSLVKFYQKLSEIERKQLCLLCRRRMLKEGEKFALGELDVVERGRRAVWHQKPRMLEMQTNQRAMCAKPSVAGAQACHEKFAKKIKAAALLTGENLGQVASQTLDNLYVENCAVSIPIIRPLIGFNKQEIINIARKIGTYETSIEPGGCCSITPPRPEVHADLQTINKIEKKVNLG